jgi:hypothetical protein
MTQSILSVTDFDSILDNYAGQQMSLIKVTQSTSNMYGEETLTDATAANIKAYFMRTGQNWDYSKMGFLEKGDAVALTKYADSVVQNDKITVGSETYRVKEAFNVPGVFNSIGSGPTYVYTACNLFLIT